MMAEVEFQFPKIVEINVGGEVLTTKLSTLTKEPTSMLGEVFTGKAAIEKDMQGRYFIDCDPEIFKQILEFLRFGLLPPKDKDLGVYKYAKIFKLQGLCSILEKFYNVHFYNRMKQASEELGPRKEAYSTLKSKLLKEISALNCSDNILVPIVFILNGDQPSCEKDHSLMVSSHLSNLSEGKSFSSLADKVIPLQTLYVNDATNMSKCLAHEICELGYCKQGFYYVALHAQNCRFKFSCGFSWKLEFVFLSRSDDIEDKRLKRP